MYRTVTADEDRQHRGLPGHHRAGDVLIDGAPHKRNHCDMVRDGADPTEELSGHGGFRDQDPDSGPAPRPADPRRPAAGRRPGRTQATRPGSTRSGPAEQPMHPRYPLPGWDPWAAGHGPHWARDFAPLLGSPCARRRPRASRPSSAARAMSARPLSALSGCFSSSPCRTGPGLRIRHTSSASGARSRNGVGRAIARPCQARIAASLQTRARPRCLKAVPSRRSRRRRLPREPRRRGATRATGR